MYHCVLVSEFILFCIIGVCFSFICLSLVYTCSMFSHFSTVPFLAHSKNELMQWCGIRRLSVCLSVNFCANRFFSQTNGRIASKLAHDGLQVSVHPGCAQGQGQRSRDTGTFVLAGKSLLPGKWPDRHQTCPRWTTGQRASRVCSRSRSKVT